VAGYSGTPLVKKLGIKEGSRYALVNAPNGFRQELEPLPLHTTSVARVTKDLDVILFFCKAEQTLRNEFRRLSKSIKPNGMIWIAWPKRSSKVETDLAFENVQRIGLATGLVDVKICAVNEVWSGLKFVIRLKDRSTARE
jgi:hypothetical protein